MAAQDQALHNRNHKIKILKEEGNGLFRMCGKRNKTVMHIPSECKKLAQLVYKKRHGRFATIIHWELCKHHGFTAVPTHNKLPLSARNFTSSHVTHLSLLSYQSNTRYSN